MARANGLSSSLSRGAAVMLCFCLAYGSSSVGVNALLLEAKDADVRIANSRGGYTREFSLLARGEVTELLMPDLTWEAWGYNANGDVSEYE